MTAQGTVTAPGMPAGPGMSTVPPHRPARGTVMAPKPVMVPQAAQRWWPTRCAAASTRPPRPGTAGRRPAPRTSAQRAARPRSAPTRAPPPPRPGPRQAQARYDPRPGGDCMAAEPGVGAGERGRWPLRWGVWRVAPPRLSARGARVTARWPGGGFAGRGRGLVDAGLVGEDHGLDAIAQPEFEQDPLDVGTDRGFFDEQRGGDLPVGQSARDQGQDLALALGEAGEPGLAGQVRHGLPRHAVDDPPRDRRREQGVALGDRVDGGDEVLGTGPLEQEPGGAGPQRAEDIVVLFERG